MFESHVYGLGCAVRRGPGGPYGRYPVEHAHLVQSVRNHESSSDSDGDDVERIKHMIRDI